MVVLATEVFQGFPTSLEAEYWFVNKWKELAETEEKYFRMAKQSLSSHRQAIVCIPTNQSETTS